MDRFFRVYFGPSEFEALDHVGDFVASATAEIDVFVEELDGVDRVLHKVECL